MSRQKCLFWVSWTHGVLGPQVLEAAGIPTQRLKAYKLKLCGNTSAADSAQLAEAEDFGLTSPDELEGAQRHRLGPMRLAKV